VTVGYQQTQNDVLSKVKRQRSETQCSGSNVLKRFQVIHQQHQTLALIFVTFFFNIWVEDIFILFLNSSS
jgi:hypothetical protein